MRKVIEGKLYDTEKAKKLAEWSNGFPVNDFRYASEELYRTKRGRFFLYGDGGPMSRWSYSVGDMVSGGSDIRPLSPKEAQQWLERAEEIELLEELFQIDEA